MPSCLWSCGVFLLLHFFTDFEYTSQPIVAICMVQIHYHKKNHSQNFTAIRGCFKVTAITQFCSTNPQASSRWNEYLSCNCWPLWLACRADRTHLIFSFFLSFFPFLPPYVLSLSILLSINHNLSFSVCLYFYQPFAPSSYLVFVLLSINQ